MMLGSLHRGYIQVLVTLSFHYLCQSEAFPCIWVTEAGQKLDPYISGAPKVVTLDEGQGLAECRTKCEKESTFICAAVNYRAAIRRCELLEENNQTAEPQTDPNYQYSLRPICAGFWQPWSAEKGQYLNTGVVRISNSNTDDLRSCMSRCVDHVDGTNCSSIIKLNSDKSCGLLDKRSDDDNVQSEESDDWQYFDRPHWYLHEAVGVSGMTISQRGNRGNDYVIMYSNKFDVDGYLVAWQYFTRSSGEKLPCETYAAVWEQSGTSMDFKLIDYTMLNYEQGLGKANFHFVTDKVVKVNQGYSPSIFVKNSSECAGNLVTFATGGSDAYYGNFLEVQNIEVNNLLTTKTGTNNQGGRSVSIRPFVAEYLAVDGVSANINSVTEKSVQLTWGDPKGYKSDKASMQNIKGGGFKIICSTSSGFNQELICSQSISPETERSAVLTLPDYTQPYYARIQVVRNFNGQEVFDDKYSDPKDFCARRPILTDSQVNIVESGVLRPGEQRTVSLNTPHLSDGCVETVRITYQTGTLGTQPKSGPWSFNKTQGVNFTITLSTNLIGSYQQQVWTKSYTTKEVPRAPTGLKTAGRSNDSATLEWTLIEHYTDATISKYQVDCRVANNTFNIDADPEELTFTTNRPDISNLEMSGLLPQVQYECQVKALLENGGYGNSSKIISLWTKPEYPTLNISSSSMERIVYESNVTVTLPNITVIDRFEQRYNTLWIVVQRASKVRRKRSTTTSDLTIDGTRTYIAAKIALADSNSTFSVGDGQMYGGVENKELGLGNYTIYVGYQAVTEMEVTEFYQLNQAPLRVVVPTTPPPTSTPREGNTEEVTTDGGGKSGMVAGIVGGVVAAIVAVAVVLAVIFVLRRRHNSKPKPKDTEQPLTPVKPAVAVKPQVRNGSKGGAVPPVPTRRQVPDAEEDTYQNMGSALPDSHDIPVSDLYKIIQAEHQENPTHPFREEFNKVGSPELVCKIGRIPKNVAKNRFKNITATDENRVLLEVSQGYESDYINANYIKDYNGKERFIASQGPNESTKEDMWRLINDTKTSTIVMLTNPIEAGKLKCAVYWPDADSVKLTIGNFTITLVEEQQFAEYVVRKLKYAFSNGPARHVKHFHFTQWPDHGVPTTSGVLSLRHRVKQDMNTHKSPVIVHCSAGVGRTGTFIGLDLLVDEAHDSNKSRHQTINVMRCVHNMRLQRTQMVQTATQYSFLYSIVSEALTCGDTAVDCSQFQYVLDKWRQPQRGNLTILKDQFKKVGLTSPILKPTAYSHGKIEENQGKNRDQSILPLDSARVLLTGGSSPDDYINAVTVDSYQTRHGFIATQTPLPDTRADLWSMIMDKKTPVIVYLNDCLDEDLYWPEEVDAEQTYSRITVKCLSSNQITERAADGLNATETTLLCSTSSKITHEVQHIEVKMRSNLPSAAQLVSLCTKLEKYVTSGRDVVTVLCRNGSRLTGLLIVALNLYQRARIEQEVDIVLELKLARRSRPQFVADDESFELLYDFVSSYLSDFNDYSNFSVR